MKHLAKETLYAVVNNEKMALTYPQGTYTEKTYNDFVYYAPSFWQAIAIIKANDFPNVEIKNNIFKRPRIIIRERLHGKKVITERNFKKLCFILSFEKWEPTYAELKRELPIGEFMEYFGDRKF